ncbi:MAG: DUF3006 domain-containing protein [Armatimonadota bacterium]
MIEKKVRAFIDRFEGDKAVLLIGENEEDTLILYSKYLPDNLTEGSVLTINIRYEPDKTEQIHMEVEDLLKKLKNNN